MGDALPTNPSPTASFQVTPRPEGGRLGVAAGRGDGGKTTLLKWMAERAMAEGRLLYLADADPMNRSLAETFEGLTPPVLQPGDASDATRGAFIRRLADLSRATSGYVGLDVGGNDRELEKTGRGVDPAKMARLANWGRANLQFDTLGVKVSAFYVLRGALADLTGLGMLLDSAIGQQDLVLVLNHGRDAAMPPGEDAFSDMRAHEIYKRALKTAVCEFSIPALPSHVGKWLGNNRMKFLPALDGDAPAGKVPLGGWEREAIAVWLGDLEDEVARTGIGRLLP
jgi:hypothetical protein